MMRTRTLPALAALALTIGLAGCGDDPAPPGGTGNDNSVDTGDIDALPDVPPECRAAYPQALTVPSLGDIALLPDGFPDPPVAATLCVTSETVGGGLETAAYASKASAEEILTGYVEALAAYAAERDEDGIGRPIVVAADGDLSIQVTPGDGGFTIAFAR